MSLIKELLEKPGRLSTGSRYTAMNGFVYLAIGALLIAWPGVIQTLLQERAFIGDEETLLRVLGMAVAVIGWLYLFGGRSGARSFVVASVFDRLLLVPAVLVPIAIAGVFPRLFIAFAILDPTLAIGAWLILSRSESTG